MERVDEEVEHRASPSGRAGGFSQISNSALPRYEGRRADIAYYTAILKDARETGDKKREREACVELCHLFTSHGTDLDAAVALARRALSIEDSPSLRTELAGWLAGLGDPGAAGLELRAAATERRARASTAEELAALDVAVSKTLVRAAVLLARARRPDAAALLLQEAAELDPDDAVPHELLGALAGSADPVIDRETGARSFLDAATARRAAGDEEAAFEDALRAFELCPASEAAARAVFSGLVAEDRTGAADEVLRDLAEAIEHEVTRQGGTLARERAADIHLERLARAIEAHDEALALGALLDLGVDSEAANVEARIDEALSLAGLPEIVAARLTRRAPHRTGAVRASAYESLARLLAGTLGDEHGAVLAWVEAATASPLESDAIDRLRSHAERTGDHTPLAEALARAVRPDGLSLEYAPLALSLAELADSELGDPLLADWARRRAAAIDSAHAEPAQHARMRLEVAVAEREALLAELEGSLNLGGSHMPGVTEARVHALTRLVRLYGASPELTSRAFTALAALCRAGLSSSDGDGMGVGAQSTDDLRALTLPYFRAPEDVARADLFESVLRARLESATVARRESLRIRLLLASLTPPEQPRRALDELLPLLDAGHSDPIAASHVLVAAAAADSARDEARALVVIAQGLPPESAAVALATAADAYRKSGALTDAYKHAEAALELDQGSARAAAALARAAAVAGGRDAAISIEQALAVVVPRAWLCDALARSLESINEHDLAFAWTQRWLALAPGDRRTLSELLRRCQLGTDSKRIADALTWVLAQPDPPDERAGPFCDALTLLYGLDRERGAAVARRALDVYGPVSSIVRERLAALADEHEDDSLAIALLERYVACDPEAPREVFLELAHRRAAMRDFDGAAREILRAAATDLDPTSVLESLEDVDREAGSSGFGPDGIVAIAEARATVLAAVLALQPPTSDAPTSKPRGRGPVSAVRVADALRALGAARWDLAEDRHGAEKSLFAAAELAPPRGYEQYARDMLEIYPEPTEAIRVMMERLASVPRDAVQAHREKRLGVALAIGRVTAEIGLAKEALDAAVVALDVEVGHPEAIALAESQASQIEHGEEVIDRIYGALASSAMGIYGRRAAHYRAARQLERLGATELALKHALAAFEAVPNEGSSWLLLMRLVDTAEGCPPAVELFARITESAPAEEKAIWLRRSLELAGSTRAGLERRLEILLRALALAPEASFVKDLRQTVDSLASTGGIPESYLPGLVRVAERSIKKLEGPDGARICAHLARLLAEAGSGEVAFAALEKAVDIDGEVEVYESLMPAAAAFAAFPQRASEFIERIGARVGDRHALTGPPLLRLASAIASAVQDGDASIKLLAEAERREAPEPSETTSEPMGDPFADLADLTSSPPAAGALLLDERAEPAPEPAPGPSAEAAPAAAEATAATTEPHELVADLGVDDSPRGGTSAGRKPLGLALAPVRDGFDALFADDDSSALDPQDLEAQEEAARERGDHEAVSELLAQRIHASSWTEQVRVLKLRRAAVLEQRLARAEDARRELLDILDETPNDKSALSVLADLYAKRGAPSEAAPLFDRLAKLSELDSDERVRYAIDGARAYAAAGDTQTALDVLDAIPPPHDASVAVGRARVDTFRRAGDMFSLIVAVDRLLSNEELSPDEAAALLVEASRAASASGDEQGALIRARRAARLAPARPDAVLECARLEYRARGMGTPREAQAVVDTLVAVQPSLPTEMMELHAFLLAEALDVIQGGGAGLRELSRRHAEIGPRPLVALGMAERLSRGRSFESAVPLFAQAIEGDLQGLRVKPRVALAATDAAIQAGDLSSARKFVEIAERAPETRAQVERRKREILAFDDDPLVARPILEELIGQSSGLARARFLQRLARLSTDGDFDIALALYEEALALSRRDRQLSNQIRAELIEFIERHGAGRAVVDDESAQDAPPSSRGGEALDVPPSQPVSSDRPDSAPRAALNPPEPVAEPAAAESAAADEPPPATRSKTHLSDPPVILLQTPTGPSIETREIIVELPYAEDDSPDSVREAPPPTRPSVSDAKPPAAVMASEELADEEADDEAEDVTDADDVEAFDSEEPPSDDASADYADEDEVEEELDEADDVELDDSAKADAARDTPSIDYLEARDDVAALVTPPLPSRRLKLPALGSLAPATKPTLDGPREEELFRELVDGYFDAGDELAKRLAERRTRSHDVVLVRRYQMMLRPGHRPTIEAARDAATQDRDEVYARALDHVMATEDGKQAPPPPLFAQPREPEFVTALLQRDVSARETEALAVVWDAGLFRKEMGAYQLSGSDRVPLTVASVLGEAYSELAAHLGSPRPLFHRARTERPFQVEVGLLAQPSIVVSGELRAKSPALALRLAAAHASSTHDLVLAAHLPEAVLSNILAAITAAFGPVQPRDDAPASQADAFKTEVGRLAGELWQRVNPRAERRLRELCEQGPLDPVEARETAHRAMRRAGLYACGDLSVSLLALAADGEGPDLMELASIGLERACLESTRVADLVRLACRIEFAEARWQTPSPMSMRR
ncbi:MAG: hypothetical protein U0271_04590 [Polyangiaceae bacterium]